MIGRRKMDRASGEHDRGTIATKPGSGTSQHQDLAQALADIPLVVRDLYKKYANGTVGQPGNIPYLWTAP